MSGAGGARRSRLLAAVAVTAVLSFVATSWVHAAFTATTDSRVETTAGSVAVDGDGTGPLLSIPDGRAGSSDTACLSLTSSGTLDSEVRHYATSSGTLSPYLDLRVEKGTSTTGYDDCSGFAPDPVNYRGRGAGVLYDGTLTSYGTSWPSGTRDPAGTGGLGGAYAAAVKTTTGLVNHWRMGETAAHDSFTGPAGTELATRAGDSGVTWELDAAQMAGQSGRAVLTADGRLRRQGSGRVVYQATTTPASADYSVEADLRVTSLLPNDEAVLRSRVSTSNGKMSCYQLYYETPKAGNSTTSRWSLLAVDGTSVRGLGTPFTQTLAPGEVHRMRLEVQGSSIRGYVDGVLRVSGTDAALTAAGRAGLGLGWDGAPSITDDSDGLQLDNFRVVGSGGVRAFRDSAGTAHGTWVYARPVAGALGGDPDRAAQIDATQGHRGETRRDIVDDFTIALWFRSSQGAGSTREFYGGALLMGYQATAAATKGFGISLLGDGTVAAGISGANGSVLSGPGFNDGRWHHVALTRKKSTGALALYVDGVSVETGTAANTTGLSGPSAVYFGLNPTQAGSGYVGALDEVATWNRPLSAAEVASLVAANGTGTETWSQGERHAYRIRVTVQQDATVYGRSGSVDLRWEAQNR